MNKTKWLTVGAVGIVIALLLLVGKGGIGGTTNFDGISLSEGLTVTGATSIASTLGITGATTASTLTQGGGIRATTTTATTATLLASDFDTENVIDVTPGGASLTLTLPATSTLTSFIPTAGQTRTIYIRNATTTADINITVAGGTGTALRNATSTGAIIRGVTGGNSYGKIDFVRKSTSDIDALLTVF